MPISTKGVRARRSLFARRHLLCSASIVALALSPMPALATGYQWAGATNDYNGTPTNWTPNGIPGSADIVTFSSGGSAAVSVSAPVSVNAWFFNGTSQNYVITGSAVTFASNGGVFDQGNNAAISIANVIAGGGAGLTVADTGGGTLTLTGANTYTGVTTITSGTLALSGSGSIANSSSVNVGDTFDISNTTSGASITSLSGSGAVTLGSKTLTITGSSGNFGGAIGGLLGNLSITGGTQTLSGVNTYTGGTSIGLGSTLALSGIGSIATTSTVADNGTFDISLTGTGASITDLSGSGIVFLGSRTLTLTGQSSTFNGSIQDGGLSSGLAGNLTINNGTLNLTGANSYTGTTTLATNGFLALGTGATLGAGAITIDSTSGLLLNGTSGTVTLSNAISGAGNVTQGGAGTYILTGTNSYAATGINAGTLQVGNGGTTGSLGTGTVTDNAALVFKRANTITVANTITGTGTLTQAGSGVLVLTATNSYTTTTINSGGTIQIGSNSATGSLGSGAVTDNGSLIVNRSNAYSQVAVISGSGSLTQAGSGTLTVFVGQAYTGATNINTGTTLALSDTGTITSSAIADSGTFNITLISTSGASIASLSGSGTVTAAGKSLTITNGAGIFAGTITTTGGVTISGGTETFNSAQNYTGGTTVNSGATLVLGGSGSVAGNMTVNGTLGYGGTGTTTLTSFTGITGTGGISELGGGTLIVNTQVPLTGTSSVTNGILIIGDASNPTASLAGPVVVGPLGTLEGHGTINGGVLAISGGKVKAGASIGTLTVNGAVLLPAGTTFIEEFSNTAGSKLAASGAVTLGGALQLVSDSATYTNGTDYKFITGSSISSTFSSITNNLPAGTTASVQYSATAVDLIIGGSGNTFLFGTYGKTPNQIAAGNALTLAPSSGALYTALGGLVGSNTAAVPGALGQLAGDIHASIRSASIEDSRLIRDTVLDRMGRDADDLVVWGAGFGGYGSIGTDGNATGLHHDSAGLLLGADLPVPTMDGLRVGIAGAIASNSARTNDSASQSHSSMEHIIAYASFEQDAYDVRLGGDFGWGGASVSRSITALGLTTTDHQSQQSSQIFATGGYKFSTDAAMVEPYIGIADITAGSGGFTETGGIGALSGVGAISAQVYSTVGLRAALNGIMLEDMALTPRADIGWQHGFVHVLPGQTVTFQNAAQSFRVLGTPLSNDAATVQLGFDLAVTPEATFSFGYDGSFSSRVQNNGLRAALDWKL